MYKLLLLLLTVLLLFTACDPCDCEDCCSNTFLTEFHNGTNSDLNLRWYKNLVGDFGNGIDSTLILDEVEVAAGEDVLLLGGGGLSLFGELSGRVSVFDYDSVQVVADTVLIETFHPGANCSRNPLCESAYNRSERQLENSTETTFLYVYE